MIGTVLDTKIGRAAAKDDGRYALTGAALCPNGDGAYAWATDGKGAGIRHVEFEGDIDGEIEIPPEVLPTTKKPNKLTTEDGKVWRNGNKVGEVEEPEYRKRPPLEGCLESMVQGRWIGLDAELLHRIAQAVTPQDDGALPVAIGIPKNPKHPLVLLAEDGKGLGLVMPRTVDEGSEKTYEEFKQAFTKARKGQ